MAVDLSKLDDAFKSIEKEVAKGMAVDVEEYSKIERVRSDSPLLNHITNGGFPRGQIIEIFGPESGSKTLISQQVASSYQREGDFVSFIDLEYSFDPKFANKLGLETTPDKFKLYRPDTAEQAYEIAEKLSEAGVGIIIFDSVAAMTPSAEFEAGYGDQQMGSAARCNGKGLRKLAPILNKNGTTAIFINQVRMKIGVMYGNPETTPGGKALGFYAVLRLRVRRKEFLTKGSKDEEPYGIVSAVEAVKSKIGPPKRKGMLTILFDSGIDVTGEYIEFAIKYGIIKKGGAWFTLSNGERLQGKERVRKYYNENEEEFTKLKESVFNFSEALKAPHKEDAVEEGEPEETTEEQDDE